MSRTRPISCALLAIVMLCLAGPTFAGVKSQAAKETAEFVMRKFGREAAAEGVEKLSQQIEALAVRHGDEVFEAVRRVGPDAVPLLAEAGEHAPQAAKLLARLGDDAVWVVKDGDRLSLFAKYGDDAAEAMIKHKEIAQPLIQAFDAPAASALKAVNTQNGRRLAMMADGGELARLGRVDQVLAVISRYGDRGMDFIWRNKGALAVSAALTAFLAQPEPFIDGTKDLAAIVGQQVASPVLERAASDTNWTLVGIVAMGIAAAYLALRLLVRRALHAVQ